MTITNKVSYQNAVSALNLPFAKACGSILTNYCWKENDATNTIHKVLFENLPLHKIYFGIDVWAQNTTQLSHPRVTYPEYGGGGSNTGIAVAKLAELGLSAGIFAPAWTFEHFPGYGRDVEQTMWDAEDLPEGITCSCGDCEKRHRPSKTMALTAFARQYSATSETFFFTDFSRAISTHSMNEKDALFDGFNIHTQLGSQSVLPLRIESLGMRTPLQHFIEDDSGRTQLVIEARNLPSSSLKKDLAPTMHGWMIPLFKLDMPVNGSLRLRVSYRDLSNMPQGVYFYVKVSGTIHGLVRKDIPQMDHLLDLEVRHLHDSSLQDPRLEELGFHSIAFDAGNGTRLVEVDYICIQPIAAFPILPEPAPFQQISVSSRDLPLGSPIHTETVSGIHRSSRGEGETQQLRLCWAHTSTSHPMDGMPYSNITGPFSYFTVYIDDLCLGRAYAAEHILPASLADRLTGREASVKIKGVGFDGQELASATTILQF